MSVLADTEVVGDVAPVVLDLVLNMHMYAVAVTAAVEAVWAAMAGLRRRWWRWRQRRGWW